MNNEPDQIVFDPRGVVETEPLALAARPPALNGLRLGVFDNTKWNANRLLRKTVAKLQARNLLCRSELLPQGELLQGRRPGADRGHRRQ